MSHKLWCDQLPAKEGARRSIDLARKIEKVTHWFNFWASVILSVWPNEDNHCTFSIFTYFSSENISSCRYSRGSGYVTEIHFFLSRYQPLMVDPWIKWRKSKDRAKKPSKKKNDHIKARADAERTISHSVPYRTSALPFISEGTRQKLLAMKLVCLSFLRLAKHTVKWWDMYSYWYGTQGRVHGGTPLYGLLIEVCAAPQGRVLAVLVINKVKRLSR